MEFEPSIADVSADDDADELEDAVVRIESLHALGVPNADIGKLKSAGIVTVAGAMMTSKKVRFFHPQLLPPVEAFSRSNQLTAENDGD